MNNPKEKLREYLKQIVYKFLNTKSLFCELKRINAWSIPERKGALNLGAYFFQLTTYSMTRIYLVELAAILSEKEERSLINWLRKACIHARSICPTCYNPNKKNKRETIKENEYRKIIDKNISDLDSFDDLISRIKSWRDKFIVHFDKSFFDTTKAIYEKYPITNSEIDELIKCIAQILHEHYLYLFRVDSRMEILSDMNVDSILRYVQAFQKVWKDKKLINKGFRPASYLE
jgi:hypothetical protein